MIAQVTDLNLIPGGVLPVVNVSQYDEQNGSLIFNLYNGDVPYTIPANTSGLINGQKPDKNVFSYPVAALSGSAITCNCTKQMTAVAGDVLTELRLRRGDEIIGTCNFILRVERAPLQDDSVISETMIPLIEQAIDIASNLAEYIQQTLDAASSASSSASQAASSASSAAQSETAAAGYNANVLALYNSIDAAKTAANNAAAAANDAAEDLENISATATTLAEGASATATYNPETQVFNFGIPKGDRGDSGVTTPMSGLIGFYVDGNSYLHVVTNDNDGSTTAEEIAAQWSVNEAGQLVHHIVIDDGTEG